jgi:UrcA family protein
MNKNTTTAVRVLTLIAAAVLGHTASADTLANGQPAPGEPLRYTVHYSDLDLSRMDGASALYARLRWAASTVCAPLENRQIEFIAKHRSCMDKAISDAVSNINRPLVSQIHQLRTKGDKAGPVRVAEAN